MKSALLTGIVWLALAVVVLAFAYVVGSVVVWLIQQVVMLVWPAVSQRPNLAGAAIVALVVLLGVIDYRSRPRRRW